MSIKFLVLGGGGVFWVLGWGGGSADFIFMGVRIFLRTPEESEKSPERVPRARVPKVPKLAFFHADFRKEFPSRTLRRAPSRNCPSPSSVLCSLLYRTEHFSRGRTGRKGAQKRRGRRVASKGGKKEKRTRENRSVKSPSRSPRRVRKESKT